MSPTRSRQPLNATESAVTEPARADAESARPVRREVVAPVPGLARAAARADDPLGGSQVAPDISGALARRSGGGNRLDRSVAADLGQRLGTDLSAVRVHTDGEADTLARSVQATAFTLGHDVYFSRGSYAPGTRAGRSLLAHELTHVRQHQAGASTSSDGLTVGRVDDPAEREAEAVARAVDAGHHAHDGHDHSGGAGGGGEGAVRRSTSLSGMAIRRNPTGRAGRAAEKLDAGAERTKDPVEAAGFPMDFVELAASIQKFQAKDKDHVTGGDNAGFKGTGGIVSMGAGAVSMWSGARDVQKAWSEPKADSFERNAAAQKGEAGINSFMTGGMKVAGGGIGTAGMTGTDIPVFDVVSNFHQAAVNGKGAIEDGVAAARLGTQRNLAKRETDQHMPDAVRGKRFGEFAKAYRDGGSVKSEDKTRWPKVYAAWLASVSGQPGYAQAAGASRTEKPSSLSKLASGFSSMFKAKTPAAAAPAAVTPAVPAPDPALFDPLTADWDKTAELADQKAAFLKFLREDPIAENRDFGEGTAHRNEYEKSLATSGGAGSAMYQDSRSLGQVASFGRNRKAEMSAVKGVKAVGHALDGAGTLTAGADMGATKVAGKVTKATAAVYESGKTLFKRAKRINDLAKTRNATNYGGTADRGLGWMTKQFFGGNVQESQNKTQEAIKESVEGTGAMPAELVAWQAKRDAFAAYGQARAAWVADRQAGGTMPQPAVVNDPGPAPAAAVGGKDAAGKKSVKALTEAEGAQHLKAVTRLCHRKIDDLLRCLVHDDDTVRKRAKAILHVIAETNLAGALKQNKILDSDLDALYTAHAANKKDPTVVRQFGVIRGMVAEQLKGIGG